VGALLLYPHLERVRPRLAYLDLGVEYPAEGDEAIEFTREQLPALLKTWEKRVKPMFTDKRFAPRPNNNCRWCYFRASNAAAGGGQCQY
jgi:hypothetical protein